jgi:spore coat protein H
MTSGRIAGHPRRAPAPRSTRGASIARGASCCALYAALAGCGEGPLPSGDAGPAAGGPPEVRGLRLIPEHDAVEVHFLEVSAGHSYTACFHTEPDPLRGECVRDVTTPHRQPGLEPGTRLWWAVFAENDAGRSPIVEVQSVVPGPPRRPLALWAEMSEDDLETLYTRSVRSDVRLPLELHLGDERGPVAEMPDVLGIRFRGHSARGHDRKAYHIRLEERPELTEFPEFNFRGRDRRAGNRILLNQTWTDPTGVRPALAFAMYNDLGVPAPTTFFADWWLNGVYEGHYIGIERIDREALRRWWLGRERGEFTLVRDRSRFRPDIDAISMFAIDPDTLGADDDARIAALQQIYDYRGEVDDHDWEALLSLLRWVRDTPAGAEWERGLEARFHVDSLLDVIAVHSMQYDFDSFADDYWLYRDDAGDGRWRIIPWDANLTFGQRWYPTHGTVSDFFYFHGDITQHVDNPLIDRTVKALRPRLDARIRELYEEVFTDDWFDETIDELAAQVASGLLRWPQPAFAVHPGQHHTAPGWFAWHLEALREFPRFRRAFLTAPRSDAPPYRFRGEVELGADGTAWITDARGWVLARLHGDPGRVLHLALALEDTPNAEGARKTWHIENLGPPAQVGLTLPYKHRPGETWLPDLEVAGRNWELTMVDHDRGSLPTRVNPFANIAYAELTLDGEHRLQLLYRR